MGNVSRNRDCTGCRSINKDMYALLSLTFRMSSHEQQLHKMTATWLLPIVSTIVASASGGVVAEVLDNDHFNLITVLWALGEPLALMARVMVLYLQRLTIYKLRAREVIVSVFLPLGPLGQGVMQLGAAARTLFPDISLFRIITQFQLNIIGPLAGEIFFSVRVMLALIVWRFELVWLFFATAAISSHSFSFNMGWWGFTLPLSENHCHAG